MTKTTLLMFLGILAVAATGLRAANSDQQQADQWTVGTWTPTAGLTQVPIWPGRAPDMTGAPETAETISNHDGVTNVTIPTITIFPPKGENTGVSILVFPGGGFRVLAMSIEGTEICDWITARGVTCVLLKYRVPKSDHYWDKDCNCHITPPVAWALQDAQRAIRIVRAKSNELHVDPNKIGVIGFSAGGYLVAQTSNIFESAYKRVDSADDLSSRPDFAIALYPGHLCSRSGDVFDPSFQVTKQTPPTFLLQAWDDPVDNICNSTVYARALSAAGVSAEVHLFAKGGHAFGLRPNPHPVSSWPILVENWLREIEVL
jgi:acetyl esterase/lipase